MQYVSALAAYGFTVQAAYWVFESEKLKDTSS